MYDVGGQRYFRKVRISLLASSAPSILPPLTPNVSSPFRSYCAQTWFQCFEHVDAIIFVVSLSEYDQSLAEDKKQVRRVRRPRYESSAEGAERRSSPPPP